MTREDQGSGTVLLLTFVGGPNQEKCGKRDPFKRKKRASKPMTDAEKRGFVEAALRGGNISKACEQAGISRWIFYKWRKRFNGGEKSHPGIQIRRHPHAKDPELVKRVLQLSQEQPEWGCDSISYYLKTEGYFISSPTIQKILGRNGRGRLKDRRGR